MTLGDGKNASLVFVAAAAAAVAAFAVLGGRDPRVSLAPAPSASAAGSRLAASLCPPGSLPDDGVCIPVPPPERAALNVTGADRIPRRPERPPEYGRYALPVEGVLSVAELGESALPDGGTRPSGVALGVAANTPVSAVELEGQDGPSRLVYAGPLWGPTVVTLHTVRARNGAEQYLVALAQLGSLRPHAVGDTLSGGATLGTSGTAPVVLETRLVRSGVDVRTLAASALLATGASSAVDARNVLSVKR
ncbi:MAG TPA: hypothetical protein VH062_08140 [Polyangiaceae bacterium]|jgi:hypothetical protein|nr:hypothetical protein [Polyangiaceae bacterium]